MQYNIETQKPFKLNKSSIIISSILALIIISVTVITSIIVKQDRSIEHFTEFYILGIDGKAENYPRKIVLNEEAFVIVGIVNKEQITTEYRLAVLIDGQLNNEKKSILLDDNGKWEEIISFTPVQPGNNQKVEFLLYRQEQDDPYLSLYLWIDVLPK